MKRLTIIVTLLLMAAFPMMAERVTPETARKVATTFLNNNGAKAAQLTDLSKSAGFPNLYIFTAEEGFVVMSADDCVQPILGYSLTGHFEVEGMPENVSSWLKGYSDEIQYAIDNQVKATTKTAQQWNDLVAGKPDASKATAVVGALIQTQWKQGSPYNNLCPYDTANNKRTVTGCVATAIAQVMKYWNYPAQGDGTHTYIPNDHPQHGEQTANFGETIYDWSNMPVSLSGSSSTEQINAVATLMYHCGVSVDMDYDYSQQNTSHNGSSASTYNVMSALETYFRYSPSMQYKSKNNYSNETWIAMLKLELDDGRPLQYRGSDAGGAGGHSFVCDGYNSDDYFHFNWGWGSYCDGYYSVNNMNPNPGASAIGSGNGIYTVGQAAIFGIEPISSFTAPSVSASANNLGITLTWNAVEGAVSYDVYKNDAKIATSLTETSFHDNDVAFGTNYHYYVRAVSSSGEKSNPSNKYEIQYLFRDIAPSKLTASSQSTDINLTWTGYAGNQSLNLQYCDGIANYSWGMQNNQETYWGQKYPSSILENLKGMFLTKISNYIYYSGDYSVCIYKGSDVGGTYQFEQIASSQSFTHSTNSLIHKEITYEEPIPIDCSKDLWIVFHAGSSTTYPAICDDYDGPGHNDAKRISSTLDGLASEDNTVNATVSWLIQAHLSDGTYTYNLYEDNTKVNGDNPITTTSYTVENITSGVHQYTVKTNYYGGESGASNKAVINVGNTTLSTLELDDNDVMTVTKGSTLTVTGVITNTVPANLIIEDGAQLITTNPFVATLQKEVDAYSEATGLGNTDGWYFIASPVNDYGTSNLALSTADLYQFNEATGSWWNAKNPYEPTHAFSTLKRNQGYLYANSADQTLAFAGEMQASNVSDIEVDLAFEGEGNTQGFNLIGNPFTRNLNSGEIKINDTAISVYYTVEGGSEIVLKRIATDAIKPSRGFMVQAKGSNQKLVFNPSAKQGEKANEPSFISIEAGNETFMDRAYVQIGGGNTLRKMSINDNVPHVYLMQDNKDYAAAILKEGQGEMPLCFKANHDGEYSITVNAEDDEMDYLHLIDNLTGADIDLLTTPSYKFEAKTSDYESRFRLVFNEKIINNPDNDFDFSSGNIQILDVTGRIVATDLNTKLAPGVYILKNTDNHKTKKIIIN